MMSLDRVESRLVHEIGCTSRSDPSLSLAKQWLESCLTQHQPRLTTEFFPDRVLDVGSKGEPNIALRSSPWTAECLLPYATLSYCWGAAEHLKLQAGTMQKFQDGISLTELPKTMQEAIELTRELDLRFLWIDSLCIVQDSVDDWRAQS